MANKATIISKEDKKMDEMWNAIQEKMNRVGVKEASGQRVFNWYTTSKYDCIWNRCEVESFYSIKCQWNVLKMPNGDFKLEGVSKPTFMKHAKFSWKRTMQDLPKFE